MKKCFLFSKELRAKAGISQKNAEIIAPYRALQGLFGPKWFITLCLTLLVCAGKSWGQIAITVSNTPSARDFNSQVNASNPTGVVNAGPDQTTCVNGIVIIAGTVTGNTNEGTWTASIPGGSFSPSNTSLIAYYIPPPGNTQPVTLTLTSNEPNPSSDDLVVTYGPLPPLTLSTTGPSSVTCDETVTILIKSVNGFKDMSSLQYSVNWDPGKFSYVSNMTTAIGGASPSIGTFAVGMGKITYAWVDPSGSEGEDLADGTLLWTIKLKALNATGMTNVSISGNPTPIEATNAQFCVLTTSVQNNANINLIQIPVEISGNDTICPGQTTTLTANGGVTYLWNTGATTAAITVNPAGTTNYTVTATNGVGCSGSATKMIVVRPQPNAQISGNTAICGGIPTTLTASGGMSYVWSTAETTETITVNPVTQTDYSVTVTNMGCTSSTAVVVTVNTAQTVSAGPDQTTCIEGVAQLAGAVGGGAGGIWDDGGAGGSFSPDKNALDAIYTPPSGNTAPITLTLSANGPCPATDEMIILYGALPPLTLHAVGPDSATCGDTILFMLQATSGFTGIKSLAYSINWDQNKFMYLGDTANIIGGSAPVIDTSMINGGQLIYNWTDPAGSTGEDLPDSTVLLMIQLIVVANAGPAAVGVTNTPVMIGATNAQLCPITVSVQNSDSIALKQAMVSCPANQSVCANAPPVTLAGAAPEGGMYSGPGVNAANMFDPALAPSGPNIITYTVGVVDCSSSCNFTITVNAAPVAAISVLENSGTPDDAAICPGSPVTLTGSGGTTYSWSTGASTASTTVSPSETTAYTLTLTDANACSATATQIITVIDSQAPTVAGGCPASSVEFCDLTVNDPQLWNEMYWWDGAISSHDLCEGSTDLNITATDDISGASIAIEYLLFLDLDGNGTMETVISSTNLPGTNNVNYDNSGNPNFSGGTPRAFDERPVPANQKYRFAIDRVKNGNNLKGYVRWDTEDLPVNPDDATLDGVAPELPYGTHKIRWILTDACGNQSLCEYTFTVKDCKPPIVECLSGVSAEILITGTVTLWATDFLQFAQDNCTPPTPYTLGNQLKFAVRKSGAGTGFPLDGAGNPIPSVTFYCNDIGTQTVELWAQDAAGNTAFCVTSVQVQDYFHCGSPILVSGEIKTEPQAGMQGVEDTQVQLSCIPVNGAPAINSLVFSDNAGAYLFSAGVPFDANCTLTPIKDDNPMNGVSTFDLVLISKHILGIDTLNSPYKMIAADANQSNSVTTFDILELRKLILGIYAELPNNNSWRFIDKNFTFADPLNPFSSIPFAENISLNNIQSNQFGDFTGIKIGDVNNSVILNATGLGEERMAGTLLLNTQDRLVQAGETFDVTFSNTGIRTGEGETAGQVQGFQFTLNLDGLQVAAIPTNSRDKVSADNFGVFNHVPRSIGTGALTASIDGAAEFTVRFHAEKAGKLSRMLQLSNQITRTEAYDAAGRRLDVALRFGSPEGMTTSGVGFELYQNQPNPWTDRTLIGFHLPASTSATLTVYDETGRMLFTQKGDYAKGYHAVSLDRSVLNTPGILYYKLETVTDVATMKMIQTR